MRVIIIGSNGFLASKIKLKLVSEGLDVLCTSRKNSGDDLYLDLSNAESFDYSILDENDVILFLASISSPDACRKDFQYAYSINVKGTTEFITRALERNAKVIFYSTDIVYGGRDTVANENTMVNPYGEYAQMKADVELKFESAANFKVLRLSYVFSKDDKFTQYLQSCLNKNEIAEIFSPLARSMVYAKDVIDATYFLIGSFTNFKPKIVNVCGPQIVDRLEFAEEFKKNHPTLKTKTISPDEEFYKARPAKINVQSLHLESLLGRKAYNISEAMKAEFRNY